MLLCLQMFEGYWSGVNHHFEIRPLRVCDAAAFYSLRQEALEREPRAFGESVEEHRRTPIETVAGRLRESDDNFVIGAFFLGKLMATAGFLRNKNLKRSHKGRIWGVYVAPSARRQGVGRAILETVVAEARKLDGMEQILLTVGMNQTAAKALYESLGFEVFGCERVALRVGKEAVDEYHMVLIL